MTKTSGTQIAGMSRLEYGPPLAELYGFPHTDRSCRMAFELGRAGPGDKIGVASNGLELPIYGAPYPFADVVGHYIAGTCLSTEPQSMTKLAAALVDLVDKKTPVMGRSAPSTMDASNAAFHDLAVAMSTAAGVIMKYIDPAAVLKLANLVSRIAEKNASVAVYFPREIHPKIVRTATHMFVANIEFAKSLAMLYGFVKDAADRRPVKKGEDTTFVEHAAMADLVKNAAVEGCMGFWVSLLADQGTLSGTRMTAKTVFEKLSGLQFEPPKMRGGRDTTTSVRCSALKAILETRATALAADGHTAEASRIFVLAASCAMDAQDRSGVLEKGSELQLFSADVAPLGALELALKHGRSPVDLFHICGKLLPNHLGARVVAMVATSSMCSAPAWKKQQKAIATWFERQFNHLPPMAPSVAKQLRDSNVFIPQVATSSEFDDWTSAFCDGAAVSVLRGPAPDREPWYAFEGKAKAGPRSRAIAHGAAMAIAMSFNVFKEAVASYITVRRRSGTANSSQNYAGLLASAIAQLRRPAWDIILTAQLPIHVPENAEVEDAFVGGKTKGAPAVGKTDAARIRKVATGEEDGDGPRHVTVLWFLRHMSKVLDKSDSLLMEITTAIAMVLSAVRCVNDGGSPASPDASLGAASATMRAKFGNGEAVVDAFTSFTDLLSVIETASGDQCDAVEIAVPFAVSALLTDDVHADFALALRTRLSMCYQAPGSLAKSVCVAERKALSILIGAKAGAGISAREELEDITWLHRMFDSKMYTMGFAHEAIIYGTERLNLDLGVTDHASVMTSFLAHHAARAAAVAAAAEDDEEEEEEEEEGEEDDDDGGSEPEGSDEESFSSTEEKLLNQPPTPLVVLE